MTVADLEELCQKWKHQRENYPGWIITPYDNRKKLIEYTFRWIHPVLENLKTVPAPDNIILLYELNWRIETCLLPIFSNWAEVYEQIILSYNPYPKLVKNENAFILRIKKSVKNLTGILIGKCWVHLIFPLIREDRWDQKHEKFQFWVKFLEPVVKLKHGLVFAFVL